MPYFSFKSIDDYKKDLELVDYLKSVSVNDEEEIYESLKMDSAIHNLRPPFYLILKADEEDFKSMFSKFELYDWAVALINSPREYLKKITNELDDKKKYLFSNFLKQLDESPVPLKDQSEIKEAMAKEFYNMKMIKKMVKSTINSEARGKDDNDNKAA
jgi:hypothetical protein